MNVSALLKRLETEDRNQAEGGHNSRPPPRPRAPQPIRKEPGPFLYPVHCAGCQHFEPNQYNPAQGLGGCRVEAENGRLCWPNLRRWCKRWNPTPERLRELCKAACSGLALDGERLAELMAKENEPAWLTPPVLRRWAVLIDRNGWPE